MTLSLERILCSLAVTVKLYDPLRSPHPNPPHVCRASHLMQIVWFWGDWLVPQCKKKYQWCATKAASVRASYCCCCTVGPFADSCVWESYYFCEIQKVLFSNHDILWLRKCHWKYSGCTESLEQSKHLYSLLTGTFNTLLHGFRIQDAWRFSL